MLIKKRQSEQTDTNKETESVINNIPTNKSPRTDGFTGKFYKTLKEELMPILLILLQNTDEGKYFQAHF